MRWAMGLIGTYAGPGLRDAGAAAVMSGSGAAVVNNRCNARKQTLVIQRAHHQTRRRSPPASSPLGPAADQGAPTAAQDCIPQDSGAGRGSSLAMLPKPM